MNFRNKLDVTRREFLITLAFAFAFFTMSAVLVAMVKQQAKSIERWKYEEARLIDDVNKQKQRMDSLDIEYCNVWTENVVLKDSIEQTINTVVYVEKPYNFIKNDSIVLLDKLPFVGGSDIGNLNFKYYWYEFDGDMYYSIELTLKKLSDNRIKSSNLNFNKRPNK